MAKFAVCEVRPMVAGLDRGGGAVGRPIPDPDYARVAGAVMFTTPLDLRADAPDRWVLLRALIWDDDLDRIEVHAGFVTDLASVPQLLRGLLDVNGRSRRAAVLHDFLYTEQKLPRAECDAIFRKALLAEGEGISRWVYWAGVRVGGWVAWANKR